MIPREFERHEAFSLRINIRGYAVSKARVTGSCDLVVGGLIPDSPTLRAVGFSYAKLEKPLRATVRSFELTAVLRQGRIN